MSLGHESFDLGLFCEISEVNKLIEYAKIAGLTSAPNQFLSGHIFSKTHDFGVLQNLAVLEYSRNVRFWSTPNSFVFGVVIQNETHFGGVVFSTRVREFTPPFLRFRFRGVLQFRSAIFEYSNIARFWSTPKSCVFGVLRNRAFLEYSKIVCVWSMSAN